MRYRFRHHPSKLATLMVTFGAGGRVESLNKTKPYTEGIAHFMEHNRFKGSILYTAKDLLNKTASVGGSWNAWTSENLVSYYMTVPEENIETAFECLSEVIINPVFPQDEMKKEQEVVCQEIRMYDDDIDDLVCRMRDKIVFTNSLSASLVGTERGIRAITRDELVRFNDEFYSPEHMMVLLASTSDHHNLAEKYFGTHDDVWAIPPRPDKVEYLPESQSEVIKKDQLQHSICISFGDEILRKHMAPETRPAYRVFNYIFGGADTSRLFMSVREDLGLVYGIGSYMHARMDGTLFNIFTSTAPENSERVIKEIEKQIDIITNKFPSEDELDRAKNQIRSAIYSRLDSSDGPIYDMIDEEAHGYINGSEYLALIDNVSANDVNDVAQTIFGANRYQVIGKGE